MPQPRFNNGASYDLMMGPWSRSVGEAYLDWMPPPKAADWLDVGCGSGAFTALVIERCGPASILGVDPSGEQLVFARERGLPPLARFEAGDASALPLADRTMDITAAALVVHFMPDPLAGVSEMARVTKLGGLVGAYVWDIDRGGFPYDALLSGMRDAGFTPPAPPSPKAGDASELNRLWTAACLDIIGEREIAVSRTFVDFEEYWRIATTSPRIAAALNEAPAEIVAKLKEGVADNLPRGQGGVVIPVARANAIWGRVR